MSSKPHKWWYKSYVLCDTDEYSYNFKIYTGDVNDPKLRLSDEPIGITVFILIISTHVTLLHYLGDNGIFSQELQGVQEFPIANSPQKKN